MEKEFNDMLDAWDRLRGACDRVECALPVQMTEAIHAQIKARAVMQEAINVALLRLPRKDPK